MKPIIWLKRGLTAAAGLTALASPLRAEVLPGTSLWATGDEVWVRFVSYEAAYTNDLYFFAQVGGTHYLLFTNKTAVPGQEVSLYDAFGQQFNAGDEVIFGIYVHNTDKTYYTGPGSRNPDGVVHAKYWSLNDPKYDVRTGFEDLYGGGDFDYNDLIFDVSGVTTTVTPEPITLILLGSGLAGLGGAGLVRRRRRYDLVEE